MFQKLFQNHMCSPPYAWTVLSTHEYCMSKSKHLYGKLKRW